MLERWVTNAWYGGFPWTWVFLPLMVLYRSVVQKKRQQFLEEPPEKVHLPVIVVGNITAGGTGKTPVVEALVRFLLKNGWSPAIVTRGYGGKLTQFPHLISNDDSASIVGDEPFMMWQSLNVPVVVDPQRNQAAQFCTDNEDIQTDVIICDDGLQHYQLNRDIEICVIDAARELGNGQLIPVGPLREPKNRLSDIDFILRNGAEGDDGFVLTPVSWVNVKTGERCELTDFAQKAKPLSVLSVAGIGNPQRFFDTVEKVGIQAQHNAFPDHYAYQATDFSGHCDLILMTHKDAVKVAAFATDQMWYLSVEAQLPASMLQSLNTYLNELKGADNG